MKGLDQIEEINAETEKKMQALLESYYDEITAQLSTVRDKQQREKEDSSQKQELWQYQTCNEMGCVERLLRERFVAPRIELERVSEEEGFSLLFSGELPSDFGQARIQSRIESIYHQINQIYRISQEKQGNGYDISKLMDYLYSNNMSLLDVLHFNQVKQVENMLTLAQAGENISTEPLEGRRSVLEKMASTSALDQIMRLLASVAGKEYQIPNLQQIIEELVEAIEYAKEQQELCEFWQSNSENDNIFMQQICDKQMNELRGELRLEMQKLDLDCAIDIAQQYLRVQAYKCYFVTQTASFEDFYNECIEFEEDIDQYEQTAAATIEKCSYQLRAKMSVFSKYCQNPLSFINQYLAKHEISSKIKAIDFIKQQYNEGEGFSCEDLGTFKQEFLKMDLFGFIRDKMDLRQCSLHAREHFELLFEKQFFQGRNNTISKEHSALELQFDSLIEEIQSVQASVNTAVSEYIESYRDFYEEYKENQEEQLENYYLALYNQYFEQYNNETAERNEMRFEDLYSRLGELLENYSKMTAELPQFKSGWLGKSSEEQLNLQLDETVNNTFEKLKSLVEDYSMEFNKLKMKLVNSTIEELYFELPELTAAPINVLSCCEPDEEQSINFQTGREERTSATAAEEQEPQLMETNLIFPDIPDASERARRQEEYSPEPADHKNRQEKEVKEELAYYRSNPFKCFRYVRNDKIFSKLVLLEDKIAIYQDKRQPEEIPFSFILKVTNYGKKVQIELKNKQNAIFEGVGGERFALELSELIR